MFEFVALQIADAFRANNAQGGSCAAEAPTRLESVVPPTLPRAFRVGEDGAILPMAHADYRPPELEEKIVSLRAARVVNCEMESGLLLTLAGIYGLRAGCICVVSDRAPWPGPSELDIDKNMDACIAVGLDAMQHLVRG